MSDQEKPKAPEMTAEQKAVMDAAKKNVTDFNRATFFFLFNQLQFIDEGEIHIDLKIKDHKIDKVTFHSSFARDMTDDGQKD